MTGCMMCNAPVEFPDFTDLCNACDKSNLDYANREGSQSDPSPKGEK